jgi:pimeloyl-ACP methyl ester carboxylesterase
VRCLAQVALSILAAVCLAAGCSHTATQAPPPSASAGAATSGFATVHVGAPTGEREVDRASILAVLEQVRPGGTVQFAPGTYQVGGFIPVTVPGITLLGHSGGTTLRGCEPGESVDYEHAMNRCAGLELNGGRQTVRNLTFESMSWAALRIAGPRAAAQQSSEPISEGGHLIEGNTFRDSDSFDVISDAPEPIVIRNNTFINTYHAVAIQGRNVHFIDNRITAPAHDRIPYGRADIAIGIAQFSESGPPCADNMIAGNRIEGHSDGIVLGVFSPGTSCRGNIVRDNTIVVRPVTLTAMESSVLGGDVDTPMVGIPLRLLNYPQWCRTGLPTDAWVCRPDETGRGAVLADNLIEGNRIIGAAGVAIEMLHASGNRIVNNTISGVARWGRFPEGVLRHAPGWWAANGSGIWLSPGSDENEIVGNTFEDIASHAVVVEGDRNRVETRAVGDVVRDLGTGNWLIAPAHAAAGRPAPSTRPSEPRRSAWIETRLVEVDGHAVEVYTAGWEHIARGRPVVVFEAGALQAWGRLPARLAEEAAVVAYSRAGIGRSEWDGQNPTPEHVVSRLHRLLETLGAPPPYLLVGQSIGGPLVLSFARRYPDAVAGLVLVDPTPPMADWLASFDDIGVGRAGHEEFLEMGRRMSTMLPPGARAEMEYLSANMGDFAGLDASRPGLPVALPVAVLLAGAGYEIPPELPTTFDIDRQHDALLRRQVALYTAWTRTLPDATITVANNSRHCIQCWDPDLVLASIRRVLYPDIRVQLRQLVAAGAESAVGEQFQLMKSRYPAERFHEDLLDRLGYELLWKGNVAEAIGIFELNVREYPGAPKPHDSLGDAYRAVGRLEEANASYRRAVQLAEAAGDPRVPAFRSKLERAEQQLRERR